jgi:hypothetical protein
MYPKTYEEYLEELRKSLNWFERFSDALSGLDERLDIANKLLIQIANTLAALTPGAPSPPSYPPIDYSGQLSAIAQKLDLILNALSSAGLTPLVNRPALAMGQKNVPTAGTAVRLPNIQIPNGFKAVIMAKPGNTGYIYLGTSKAGAEDTSTRFDRLEPGDSISLQITTLELVWVDASADGDGVSWIVEQ